MSRVWKERQSSQTANHSENTRDESSWASSPPFIQKILKARGLTAEQAEVLLQPKLSDLQNPLTMLGMQKAVDLLVEAHQKNSKIAFYADFDLDGTSGLALALDAFAKMGFQNVIGDQPLRLSEGYGVHPHRIRELAASGVELIVTIDVGISAIEAAETARELGVKMIVTDHHQPGEKLPDVDALINPNQVGDESVLQSLCGTGVIFYLVRALRKALIDSGRMLPSDLDLKSLLDCYTIGTLTDLVPLTNDNRVLVKHGLNQLSKTQRPGLQVLLRELGLSGRALTSQDVAIRFAPKLNALSRMELGLRPLDIFLAKTSEEAEKLVTEMMAQNSTRKDLQNKGEAEAMELAQEQVENGFVFVTSPQFHRGVVGLIATRLASNLGVPAFVGSEDEQGVVVGSARRPSESELSLLDLMESARDLFERFGGHDAAAGFEFHLNQKQSLIDRLRKTMQEQPEKAREDFAYYDAEIQPSDLNEVNMRWLDHLEPFGKSFETPVFYLKDVEVSDVMNLRGGHLRLKIRTQFRETVSALYFSPPASLKAPKKGDRVSLLVELQWNFYLGSRSLQLLVKEMTTSAYVSNSHQVENQL